MADKVKVAVRARPFNRRETELGTKVCMTMNGDQTVIHHPLEESQGKPPKKFAFDHCFWSFDEKEKNFASQEYVFQCLGTDILDNAFKGYNACIFAYGQTGSGKSYSMMGTHDGTQKGIIPRLCDALFERIKQTQEESCMFRVEVSYMEIYNEKVRDLLCPKGGQHNLKVREHNILGPYVDGLSSLAVDNYQQIFNLMEEGNKSRTVAATNMNSESSRSHAVFNIIVTQTLTDIQSGVSGEKVSKMSLVDLAGSERAQKTGASGDRLKEGSNINKSLTTLGLVISALADASAAKPGGKQKFVPYRDSVLTWLLKDNLGGNSKTVMVATLSPAADNYEESLSTLRYADRAKRITQHAVVNEDPNARIIRELREEVEALRAQLAGKGEESDLRDRLRESEKIMSEMSRTWEDRLAESEKVHIERQKALESMGIDVQASGIKVEHGKFYLVNLNADPSMNELLVYYLKDNNIVGRPSPDADKKPDIQLQGLGIEPHHCELKVINTKELWVEPGQTGARTCVNGTLISEKKQLFNGDRILWGNNHFFRVNCPRDPNAPKNEAVETQPAVFDYAMAREEMIMHEMGNDPLANAVNKLEKQHENEKQEALNKQRQMYEKQIQLLRSQMSPMGPMTPSIAGSDASGWAGPVPEMDRSVMRMSGSMTSFPSSNVQAKFVQWAQERDEMFKKSLAKLKEDIVRANAAIREASLMASDMSRETTYNVTLQIPADNLSPSKIKTGAFVSEPAIVVKRKGKPSQIWSMDKLENKLIDMRDLYQEWMSAADKSEAEREAISASADPFFESQENHNLIGVANVFLEVLFHEVKLDYHVPIISQQGEVSGRLHVEIYRVSDNRPQAQTPTAEDDDSSIGMSAPDQFYGSTITCRVKVKKASQLPAPLSQFVFCQYSFFGQGDAEPVVVPPLLDEANKSRDKHTCFFDHEKDWTVTVSDEFLEHVQDGALSIQVWGHKTHPAGSTNKKAEPSWDIQTLSADKSRSLHERWAEVTRRLQVWVHIRELNDNGEYVPVEMMKDPHIQTGGIFQLRQGQQKRVCVRVETQQANGSLPLICQQITSISVGCITARSKQLQKGLDSYQEEDLNVLRDRWSEALAHRRSYLDDQIQRLMHKSTKSETDVEREQALIAQWVALTEERNAVLVPTPNSGLPGAPADWEPDPGMEKHIPVIFLDFNAEDMGSLSAECLQAAGVNSILPKEHGGKMFQLPILRFDEAEISAVAAWDSSIHEHTALNRVTPDGERVYAICKVVVRISHPAEMELVLRKRLSFNIVKRIGLAQRLMRKFAAPGSASAAYECGIMYDIVSNVPKATEDPEARETLALVAAQGDNDSESKKDTSQLDSSMAETGPSDGESYIEKYTKGIANVESILALDRLRQEVAIKELLSAQKRGGSMKKSSSMPQGFGRGGSSVVSPTGAQGRMGPRRPMNLVSEEGGQGARAGKGAAPNQNADSTMSSGYGSAQILGQAATDDEEAYEAVEPDRSNPDSPTVKVTPAEAGGGLSRGRMMSQSTYSDYGAKLAGMDTSQLTNSSGDAKDMQTSGLSIGNEGAGGSASDRESVASEGYAVPAWLRQGVRVTMASGGEGEVRTGRVEYIGSTEFAPGVWVGAALDTAHGQHDGTLHGVMYFSCPEKHGVFVRPDKLSRAPRPTKEGGSPAKRPPRPPTTGTTAKQLAALRRAGSKESTARALRGPKGSGSTSNLVQADVNPHQPLGPRRAGSQVHLADTNRTTTTPTAKPK